MSKSNMNKSTNIILVKKVCIFFFLPRLFFQFFYVAYDLVINEQGDPSYKLFSLLYFFPLEKLSQNTSENFSPFMKAPAKGLLLLHKRDNND